MSSGTNVHACCFETSGGQFCSDQANYRGKRWILATLSRDVPLLDICARMEHHLRFAAS
jgi:hypothetical protein